MTHRNNDSTLTLTENERNALLDQPDKEDPMGLQWYLLLRLGLFEGFSLQEVVSFQWKNVISTTGQYRFEPRFNQVDRAGCVHSETLDILQKRKVQQFRKWIQQEAPNCPHVSLDQITTDNLPFMNRSLHLRDDFDCGHPEYVFTSPDGSPLQKQSVRETVSQFAREAGISKEVSWKVFHQTYIEHLMNDEVRRLFDHFDLLNEHRTRILGSREYFSISLEEVNIGSSTAGGTDLSLGALLVLWRDETFIDSCPTCEEKLYIWCLGASLLSGRTVRSGYCFSCERPYRGSLIDKPYDHLSDLFEEVNNKASRFPSDLEASDRSGPRGEEDQTVQPTSTDLSLEDLIEELKNL